MWRGMSAYFVSFFLCWLIRGKVCFALLFFFIKHRKEWMIHSLKNANVLIYWTCEIWGGVKSPEVFKKKYSFCASDVFLIVYNLLTALMHRGCCSLYPAVMAGVSDETRCTLHWLCKWWCRKRCKKASHYLTLIFLTASFTSYNLRFKTVQSTWVSASHFWLMTAILAWVVKDILNCW